MTTLAFDMHLLRITRRCELHVAFENLVFWRHKESSGTVKIIVSLLLHGLHDHYDL